MPLSDSDKSGARIADELYSMRETQALLDILALGNRQIKEGKVIPAAEAIARLQRKNKA
jgi:hypothetical protein